MQGINEKEIIPLIEFANDNKIEFAFYRVNADECGKEF